MILLPFYLPYSSLLSSPRLGLTAAALWLATQVRRHSQASQTPHPSQILFSRYHRVNKRRERGVCSAAHF